MPPKPAKKSTSMEKTASEHSMETTAEKEKDPIEAGSWNLWLSFAVFFVVFLVLSFSSSFLPAVWDEGHTAQRAGIASIWNHRLAAQLPVTESFLPNEPALNEFRVKDTLASLLSREELDRYWIGLRTEEGHPLFPIMLMSWGIRYYSFPPMPPDLRFYSILFFSLSLGVVFYRLSTDFGRWTALFGVLSILLIPRLFAHAQLATWDSPMVAAWLLAWAFFPLALKTPWGAILYGVAVGMTIASKFSGVGVLFPPVVWLVFRGVANHRLPETERLGVGRRTLAVHAGLTFAAAVLTFVVLNPPLWNDPIGGFAEFLSLNLNRRINVSTLFFGRLYSLKVSLPWYNTLLWTAITVPVGILTLFFIGLAGLAKNKEKRWAGLFLILNFLPLMIIRALPGTPVHDGVRLFVPAFSFLAIIAGFGAATLWNLSNKKRLAVRAAVCLIYLSSLFNMFWYAPQWLSYYNFLIGGLPGAVRAGMEQTYFWDAYDLDVVVWLLHHTKPGDTILYSEHAPLTIDHFYRRELPGRTLRMERFATDEEKKQARFYVQQQRTGMIFDDEKLMQKQGKPVFVKTIRKGGWGPWNLGCVPLITIHELSNERQSQ